jgi:hypothetical protein
MTVLVCHRHYRELRLCNNKAREFFHLHGLDWHEFVVNGIPEEQLIATNDHFALMTVERARKEGAEKTDQS